MARSSPVRARPAVRSYREPENVPTDLPGPLALSFTVHHDPVPKARPRVVKGRTYTDARTSHAEGEVRVAARLAGIRPLGGRLSIRLDYYRKTLRRCDWDNLAKLTTDALNGIAYADDSQIVEAHVTIQHDPINPRTEVEIVRLSDHSPATWDDL